MAISAFPWEIRDVESELTSELMKYFKNEHTKYVRVGPKGYFLPETYKKYASSIYNMEIRPSDVFVNCYPRTGSTLTREVIWIVANDWNFTKSKSTFIHKNFVMLEKDILFHPLMIERFINVSKDDKLKGLNPYVYPDNIPMEEIASPRFLASHLPLSLLPPSLLDTAKMVYVTRDPRDVAVSFYHLSKLFRCFEYEGDFKTFWNFFTNDSIYWTPYFEHIKEAWAMRQHPNMLFLFYEDILKDLPSVIRKVASFFNKPCNEEQIAILSEHLKFDNFKKNKYVNYEVFTKTTLCRSQEQPFVRKGKSGDWQDYFDEEMTQQAEQWIADNLRDTDFRFPHLENI